jgi:DNA-binding transcriptional LysR family regulator
VTGDVQLRQLEYLVALARERHFGRAAVSCHASQSTLSAGLQALERTLEVTIVQRGHRFRGFTPEGKRVVGWAHRILADRDALHTDLDRMRAGLSATVRIGAIPTAVPMTSLLTLAWTDAHPRSRTRVEVLASREIDRKLADFELDAGLTYLDEEVRSAHVLPLYRERYLLLTSAGGELSGRERARWRDVDGLRLCGLTRSMKNRRIIDRALHEAGVAAEVDVETDTVAALYAHLGTGRWSAIIAHTWLRAFGVPDGMVALPLDGPGPRPVVGLVLGDHGPASHVAQAFLDAVAAADVPAALEGLPLRGS